MAHEMTRQERISLHKKQERLQVRNGTPTISELKEGVPVLRMTSEGPTQYAKYKETMYKSVWKLGLGSTVVEDEGGVTNADLAVWTGSSYISQLGTITNGIWNGDIISAANGGTGLSSIDTLLNSNLDYVAVASSLGLGNVENVALSSWVGTSNITTLGTIATGVWEGTAIASTYIADAFLINNGSDTTTGTITAGGFTTTGTWTFDTSAGGTTGITNINITNAFTDDDVTLMSAGAIKEKIEGYGYSTTTGDITGVAITTDSGGGSKAEDTGGSADFSILGSNGVGVTNSGTTITAVAVPGEIDHDSLNNFVSNEHIDWTGSSAGTIHSSNYVDNNTNTLTTWTLRDDDNDSFTIAHSKFLKVVAATGTLGTNIAGSGSTGDPWVLTITSPDTTTNTQLSQEEVEDFAGAMVATGGTKTRISVTYQDGSGNMDFVVDDMSNVPTNLTKTVSGSGFSINSSTGDNIALSLVDTDNWGLMSDEMFDNHILNNAKATDVNHNVTTNLSISRDGTKVDVVSSDGTNAVLPLADTDNWGVMSDEMFDTLAAATTNVGTVTSVGTTGTVNGVTLTGTVTVSGNLTLGGTLAINNGDWSGTDLAITNGGTGASDSNAWLNTRVTTNANGSLNYDATGATAVNHDSLTGFDGAEHFTMANITAIGSGTGVISTASGTVSAVSMATKGQLLVGDGTTHPQTLAVGGTNNHVLVVASGETTGMKWAANPSAAIDTYTNNGNNRVVTSVDGTTVNGEENLQFDGTGLKIKEVASAASDTAAYGQLWVKNTVPCQLWYTDDAGNDHIVAGTGLTWQGYGAAWNSA